MDEAGLKILNRSKPIGELGKGDKLSINGKEMLVDSQYLFMEHKNSKEMIIEFFNVESEREYQLRYFDDQVDISLEIYELQGDFQYVKREPKTLEW